ncbi:MAG: hypothetical protein R3D55_23365 [Chloroflexota bacterium]
MTSTGKALAYQGTILTLGVIPGQIEDEPAMLAALSPMLNQTPEEIKKFTPALPGLVFGPSAT